MGRLVDGRWSADDIGTDASGRFVRRPTQFRAEVTADGASGFRAEPGRYHLYVSHACGWSHRALLFRALKRLEHVIGVTYVEPVMLDEGWELADGADPVLGKRRLHEIYTAARADYTGRASVPVLWDTEQATIVSNESIDITRSFDSAFDTFGDASRHFFTPGREDEIEAMNAASYESVCNGVYRAGFAASQEAHEEAARAIFARLDELERVLAKQRFLLGSELTAADLYLFPTIFRFDAIYYVHFKCCLRRIVDYPSLWGWTRDVYQHPGVSDTCRLDICKLHYYRSHRSIHPRGYVPVGPDIDFDEPHDCARLG